MTGTYWIILNILLAAGAVGGTVAWHSRRAAEPPVLSAAAEPGDDSRRDSSEKTREPRNGAGKENAAERRLSSSGYDDLWRHSLFTPGRAETALENGEAAAAEAAAIAAQNVEFELIGVARIAAPGRAAEAVAILRNKAVNGRRPADGNRRGQRRSAAANNNSRSQLSNADPAGKNRREVFRTGEKINLTGYTLKSIDVDKRQVVVSRGTENVTLGINFTSSEAVSRRESVGEIARKKREARNAAEIAAVKRSEEAKNEADPGAPPPPPGGDKETPATGKPGAPGSGGTANSNETIRQRMQQRIQRNQTADGGAARPVPATRQTPGNRNARRSSR